MVTEKPRSKEIEELRAELLELAGTFEHRCGEFHRQMELVRARASKLEESLRSFEVTERGIARSAPPARWWRSLKLWLALLVVTVLPESSGRPWDD